MSGQTTRVSGVAVVSVETVNGGAGLAVFLAGRISPGSACGPYEEIPPDTMVLPIRAPPGSADGVGRPARRP
jgi:hypothetical protein